MKQRIISALIAIPIFAWIMLAAPNVLFNIAWGVIINIAAYEWAKLLKTSKSAETIFVIITGIITWGIIYILNYDISSTNPNILLISSTWLLLSLAISGLATIAWLFLVPFLLKQYTKTEQIWGGEKLVIMLGILFLTAFTLSIMRLKFSIGGSGILALLILIWASDAGAYFFGRAFGKRKLSPVISPNKTWEGFIGGLLLAIGFFVIFFFIAVQHISTWEIPFSFSLFTYCLICSLVALIYASIGDLFESMLKRHAGVKDSGAIMPGHGGAYDRIDSWIPGLTLWNFAISASFLFYF